MLGRASAAAGWRGWSASQAPVTTAGPKSSARCRLERALTQTFMPTPTSSSAATAKAERRSQGEAGSGCKLRQPPPAPASGARAGRRGPASGRAVVPRRRSSFVPPQPGLHFRQGRAVAGGHRALRQPGHAADLLKRKAPVGLQFDDLPPRRVETLQRGGDPLGGLLHAVGAGRAEKAIRRGAALAAGGPFWPQGGPPRCGRR